MSHKMCCKLLHRFLTVKILSQLKTMAYIATLMTTTFISENYVQILRERGLKVNYNFVENYYPSKIQILDSK